MRLLAFVIISLSLAVRAPTAARAETSAGISPPTLTFAAATIRAEQASGRLFRAEQRNRVDRLRLESQSRVALPQVSLFLSHEDGARVASGDTRSRRVGVTVEQPLFDAGRRRSRRSIAEIRLRTGQENITQIRREIAESTRQLISQIDSTLQARTVNERAYRRAVAQLEISEVERELGHTTDLEHEAVALHVLRAESALASSRVEVRAAEQRLLQLLGLPMHAAIRITPVFDAEQEPPALPGSIEEMVRTATAHNPLVTTAALERSGAHIEAEQVRRSAFPTITLTLSASMDAERLPFRRPTVRASLTLEWSGPPAGEVSTESTLGGPHPPSRTVRSSVQARLAPPYSSEVEQHRIDQDAVNARRAHSEAVEELAFSLQHRIERYSIALDRRRIAGEARELAERQFRLSEVGAHIGTVRQSEVIEASRRLAEFEHAFLEASFAAHEAYAQIVDTVGIGERP